MGKIVGLIIKEEKKSFVEPKVENKVVLDSKEVAKEVVKEEKKK